jgi:hypothetical protein
MVGHSDVDRTAMAKTITRGLSTAETIRSGGALGYLIEKEALQNGQAALQRLINRARRTSIG